METDEKDMNQYIKFSIIIPVYNAEKYLSECINSVLKQSYNNWEAIFVNDGSADKSGVMCNEYSRKDNRIFSYHKSNEGQLATRIYAISKSCGDYVVFLDSDDTLVKNALQIIFENIIEGNYDCIIYNMQRVINGNVKNNGHFTNNVHGIVNEKKELYRILVTNDGYNSLCRKAFKRECINNKPCPQLYRIRHGEDLLQSLSIIKNCTRIKFIDDILYNYTVNPNSITETVYDIDDFISFKLRQMVYDFLIEENINSKNDFADFINYCKIVLSEKIKVIASQKITTKNKISLLRKIKKDRFYLKYICDYRFVTNTSCCNKIVFTLFKASLYRIIIFLSFFKRIRTKYVHE